MEMEKEEGLGWKGPDRRTIYHDVHASELRPDLRKHADLGSIDHVRL